MDKILPSHLQKTLEELVVTPATSSNELLIARYIMKWLDERDIPFEVDAEGNILAVKGEAEVFPCIASHMDTVHMWREDVYFDYKKDKWGDTIMRAFSGKRKNKKQVGTGGDDKCGILACFDVLDSFDNVKAAFFTAEEVGCVGSSAVDHSWFYNVGYVIQLDRWGKGDFICKTYSESTVSGEYFKVAAPILKEFGYTPQTGLITDSINLFERGLPVSCVNVSCGYYQHHSNSETICLEELANSLEFTKKLISELGENEYAHEATPTSYRYPSYGKSYRANSGGYTFDSNNADYGEAWDSDEYAYNHYNSGDEEEIQSKTEIHNSEDFTAYVSYFEKQVANDTELVDVLDHWGITEVKDFVSLDEDIQNLIFNDANSMRDEGLILYYPTYADWCNF